MEWYQEVLQRKLDRENYQKLQRLENPHLHQFVASFVRLCAPQSVFVATDSPQDIAYVRRRAIETGEEKRLAKEGQTVHFDGYHDQARDKENTKYLLPPGTELGERLNSIGKEEGLREVRSYLKDSMRGKQLFVRFYCLGPRSSPFSIPAVQLTDSSYVAHSEDLLYRPGFEEFHRLGKSNDFLRFVHSAGELRNGVSVNIQKRRIYIDLEENIVYSTNTQYGGNTIGLKKLALRLAIRKGSEEGWLAEHMLVMGVRGPGGRLTYFAGAFPSYCGKTSTAMMPGETIVGDDIAYLRAIGGRTRAVNVECGIFGIIQDVNAEDDPIIWKALNSAGEVIFSNVLVSEEGVPRWLGDGRESPRKGINHSGQWWHGKQDKVGQDITLSHKNARYTLRLERLSNCDSHLNDPQGVELSGIMYGGRDSDTSVPVEQSFDWVHGIITKGASLESETTAATLGKEGVRLFNPMSNIDFVSIPLGQYIENNINFAEKLSVKPLVFGVNYFLRDNNGRYLNAMEDKRVWLKWMELRVHREVGARRSPTGLIPEYEDLRRLFAENLGKGYRREDYTEQFCLRIPANIQKIDRIERIYRESVPDAPAVLFDVLEEQRGRLEALRRSHGDFVSPSDLQQE